MAVLRCLFGLSATILAWNGLAGACGTNGSSYDFVVVGGGTAGLAVASRLSEALTSSCILVLEAGPDAPDENKINVPGMKGSTIGGVYDWNFTTTAQPSVANRSIAQTRGKVLGGSSALNLMSWDRASAVEYDAWGKVGNPGWNWTSMISAMTTAENFHESPYYQGDSGVGYGGPVDTMINDYVPKQQYSFIPTLENLRVAENNVSLGGNPIGAMFQPSNIRFTDRKRSYSAYNPGYPSIAGSNLEIRTGVTVAKINFDSSKNPIVATGVTLNDGSVINAAKEVILSAGSIQSPGLLEVSGIGNKTILSNANIPQLVNLPGVGENLQDHLRVEASYRLKPNFTSFDILKFNSTYAAEQLALYQSGERSIYDYTGSGYAFVSLAQATGDDFSSLLSIAEKDAENPLTDSPFEPVRSKILLDYLKNETTVPHIEVVFSDGYTGVKGYPSSSSPLYGSYFFTLLCAMEHPFSVGSVHVTSPNVSVAPTINPNYLAQEFDVQQLIATAKYARKVASTSPLNDIWVDEYEPGVDVVANGTGSAVDAQWRKYVQNSVLTLYHPVGTCAMLPQRLHGVVDPELVVYGTANLRVIDASIIPILISAHIQTAVYGIAERVGSLDRKSADVGSGLVGAPACGDVIRLDIQVDEKTGKITKSAFKTFGCGSAIASSSYLTTLLAGKTLEEAGKIQNTQIANELCLPPVKLHCSLLAEDAIKAAIKNYESKRPAAAATNLADTSKAFKETAAQV
ncbi:Choline dehydrogenase [Talaromyces islandicus]|uniref:Choline dehydrogenase n=1 Tax=Talaromyces islandicus TaxID=28573 RepID=A0A0U1M9K3_TALIS|nr:Choline dehydrogenase [Talaromyces islandicus]